MPQNENTKKSRRPDVNRAALIEMASQAEISMLDEIHMPCGASFVNLIQPAHKARSLFAVHAVRVAGAGWGSISSLDAPSGKRQACLTIPPRPK